MKILIVDPPNGWRYNFPAPLQENYEQQLRNANYPEHDIAFALRCSRYWEADISDIENER